MSRTWFRRSGMYTAVILVCLAMTCILWTLSASNLYERREAGSLTFVNDLVSPDRAPVMGELVGVELELEHVGAEPITITRARTSCGCTQVYPTSDPEHSEDVVIPPNARMKWTVMIDTSLRVGRHDFSVWLDYVVAGVSRTIRATVRLTIRRGFWAEPTSLNVKPAKATEATDQIARLFVCDDGSADDLWVSRVAVSDADTVGWSMIPLIDQQSAKPDRRCRQRYEVTLTVRPQQEGVQTESHWIRFYPNLNAAFLQVPIEIRRPPPSIRALPVSVIISRPLTTDDIVRRIIVKSNGQPLNQMTVDADTTVRCKVIATKDQYTKQVVIRIVSPWKERYFVRIRNGNQPALTVPVRLLSPPHKE